MVTSVSNILLPKDPYGLFSPWKSIQFKRNSFIRSTSNIHNRAGHVFLFISFSLQTSSLLGPSSPLYAVISGRWGGVGQEISLRRVARQGFSGWVLTKFERDFSSKSREIYVSVIEILWGEVFETWTVLMFGFYLQKTKRF